MAVTQVLELLKQYAEHMKQPGDAMAEVLTSVSDEHSIPLKLYGADVNATGELRNVLDLQRLELTNFMGVAKRAVDVGPGVTLLYGPNGSGKTTAMKAALYALFGAPAAGVKLAEHLITAGQSETQVVAQFAGGVVTRACETKAIKKGKRIGAVDVAHSLKAQIAGDKASATKEAQGLIDGWLGVDADFVRRVACLEQGALTQVMDEQPARRRELFYRMLSLEPAEETRKALAKALDMEENKRAAIDKELEQIDKDLASLRHRQAQYPVAVLEAKRDELMPLATAASADPQALKELRQAFADRELALIAAKRAVVDLAQYRSKIEELKRDPAFGVTTVLSDFAKDRASAEMCVKRDREELVKEQAELTRVANRGAEVKALPPTCPTCAMVGKQCDLTPELKEQFLVTLRGQYVKASQQLALTQGKLKLSEEALALVNEKERQAHQASARQKFVLEQIQLLEEAIGRLPADPDPAAIEVDVKRLADQIEAKAKAGSPIILEDLRGVESALAEGRSIEAQLAAMTSKRATVAARPIMGNAHLEALRFCVAAFAKDGMPLWLARQHLGRINAIAAEVCTLDKYLYQFGPDLEIVIYEGGTASEPLQPQLTCGSARERGAVVLMAALGRYLQELSGLSIPFLWVDELPFQDDANIHLVVDMMKKLTKWYPKVILCASRWEELVNQFDHEICLKPEDASIEMDRQRQVKAAADAPKKAAARAAELQELPKEIQKAAAATVEEKPAPLSQKTYTALCDAHAKEKKEHERVVPSQPFQCVRCLEVARSAANTSDVVKQAQDALASIDHAAVDSDMGGDCPF